MCEPISASIAMASIAMAQKHQADEAQKKMADAQNARYEQNQALQNEAYAKDMEAFYDKEVDMKLQDFKNAEDAADAKLDQQIESQQAFSALRMANFQASGQSSGRSVAVLSRQLSEQAFDIDDQLRMQNFGTRRDMKSMQYDKIARHNSAVGAINSVARAEYQSGAERTLGMVTSGLGGGMQGYAMAGGFKSPNPGTTPPTTPPTTPTTRTGMATSKTLQLGGMGSGSSKKYSRKY